MASKHKETVLLASAPDIKGILQCVANYWYSPPAAYYVDGERLMRSGDNSHVENYRIIVKRGRYRFEHIVD
jgi:hypothetical protein